MSADIEQSALQRACREAFDAGRLQGEKEAAGYEWGAAPSQTRDEAFAEFWEAWDEKNTAASPYSPLQDDADASVSVMKDAGPPDNAGAPAPRSAYRDGEVNRG